MKRILLVEDDPVIQNTLRTCLSEAGYQLTTASLLSEGRKFLKGQDFELLLLDVNLPDGTSFDLCREAHQEHPSLPIVIITASLDEESAVKGLSVGAADYIRKPFGRRELMLRVKRLIGEKAGSYQLGQLQLNLDQHKAFYASKELSLTPMEFSVLSLLMHKVGETISRETILAKVDAEGNMGEQTLNSHLSRLRSKLQAAGCAEVQITPVYGVGYRLEKKA